MSVAQYTAALERANEVRLARGAIKRKINAGEMTVADALSEWSCAGATVGSLLRSQHRWGDARTTRFLTRLSWKWSTFISESRRVEDLSKAQIEVLRRALEGRG